MNGEQTNFRRDVAMLVRLLRDHDVLTELSCDEHACVGGIHDNECGFACTPDGCHGHAVNCDCWLHDAHHLLDRLERSLEMGPSYDPDDCNGRSGSADDCPGCQWCQDIWLRPLTVQDFAPCRHCGLSPEGALIESGRWKCGNCKQYLPPRARLGFLG